MTHTARTREGLPVWAGQYAAAEWEALKLRSTLGDFVMDCCPSPAVLKTSPLGLQFFAHPSGECDTAPETVWHRTGKSLVLAAARRLGYRTHDEFAGGTERTQWRADTAILVGDRTIVVELQRSYQHFRDYLKRQTRYREAGVESYWLLREECMPALTGSIARARLRDEFGGRMPSKSFFAALPQLPWAVLSMADEPAIHGPGLSIGVQAWIGALVEGRYRYDAVKGCWTVA